MDPKIEQSATRVTPRVKAKLPRVTSGRIGLNRGAARRELTRFRA